MIKHLYYRKGVIPKRLKIAKPVYRSAFIIVKIEGDINFYLKKKKTIWKLIKLLANEQRHRARVILNTLRISFLGCSPYTKSLPFMARNGPFWTSKLAHNACWYELIALSILNITFTAYGWNADR